MALNLYKNEIGYLQPAQLDGKSLPPKQVQPTTYVSGTPATVAVLTVLADGFTAQVQAVGAVGSSAVITATTVTPNGSITATITVNVVDSAVLSETLAGVSKPADVKERPLVGPPG